MMNLDVSVLPAPLSPDTSTDWFRELAATSVALLPEPVTTVNQRRSHTAAEVFGHADSRVNVMNKGVMGAERPTTSTTQV
jgi:hypothetical protein